MATFDYNLILPIIGVLILLTSIAITISVISILKVNTYNSKKFFGVIILLWGFISGYTLFILETMGIIDLPIDPNVIIGLVYFAGSIFTFVALDAFKTLLVSLLGKNLSTSEAQKLFLKHTGIDPRTDLNQEYVFECENCNNMIKYTISDVVKMSNPILERGITVEAVFGVKSYLLRPQHICKDGRREFTIVHDAKLAVRSKERSRILYKLQ